MALSVCLDYQFAHSPSCLPALTRALLDRRNVKRHPRILELGCGCGLVGLTLAQCFPECQIMLTDLPKHETFIKSNIEHFLARNSDRHRRSNEDQQVTFQSLDWTCVIPPSIRDDNFDIVLATDVTYNPDTSPDLTEALSKLVAQKSDTVVVIGMKTRHSSENVFFECMEQHNFVIQDRTHVLAPSLDINFEDSSQNDAEAINLYTFQRR